MDAVADDPLGSDHRPTYCLKLYNEANLFHEALHGYTGSYDNDYKAAPGLETYLNLSEPSLNIRMLHQVHCT